MGAPKGNDNAKSKYGRTRVLVHLSVGNPSSNPRLERICKYLGEQGKETTDQAIVDFVKEEFYKHLDEMFGE